MPKSRWKREQRGCLRARYAKKQAEKVTERTSQSPLCQKAGGKGNREDASEPLLSKKVPN